MLVLTLLALIAVAGFIIFNEKRPSTVRPSDTKGSILEVVRINDNAHLYSVEIPKDWGFTTEGARGIQVSQITGQSPDWTSTVDNSTEGPAEAVHYKTGVSFQFHVSREEPVQPYHENSELIESRNKIIDAVPAAFHSFATPSTAEGRHLDAHVTYKGKYFTFLFTYNPATYPQGEEVFMHILNSVRFAK